MKVALVPTTRRVPGPWWAWAVVALWAAVVSAGAWAPWLAGRGVELCMFKRLTGLPCPTCGATRGCLRLLAGDLAGGWLCNPLLFSVAGIAAAALICKVTLGRKLRVQLSRMEKLALGCLGVGLVLGNWAYVICYVG